MKRDYPTSQFGGFGAGDRSRHSHFIQAGNKGKQLMSFQNYVRTLSNSVDETTACNKYKDFMASLSQSKVGRFFDANKDREWFRIKYHPLERQKTLLHQNLHFQKRLKIFNDLNDKNYFDTLSYSISNSSAILNLMDAIAVQLEDGPEDLVQQLLSRDDTKIDFDLRNKYIPIEPTSIVIDNIDIETTLAEIQDFCMQADSNLLRIAQLQPYYVAGGHLKRRVVAIYRNSVNLRDTCWRLSRLKLNDKALNVHISKCLTQRIYPVDVLACHHMSVINDIKNVIILILNFDQMRSKQIQEDSIQQADVSVKMEVDPSQNSNGGSLDNVAPLSPPGSVTSTAEEDEGKPFDVSTIDDDKEKEKKKLFELKFNIDLGTYRTVSKLNKSKNPILKEAYNYLIEYVEDSALYYQLSKVPRELQAEPLDLDKNEEDKCSKLRLIVKNLPYSLDDSTKFLDKMLWYLRIVHCFDYYKKLVYRHEDELTLKMSVIHLRDDTSKVSPEISPDAIKSYIQKQDDELNKFAQSQAQKYVTKDEERFNYKSYGKVITDELTSYSQRMPKPKSTEMEEVYKCKHCTRVFQKLADIGRHFVSKHRWAIDAIELETDFFNAYLFDPNKINPCPPEDLVEMPINRFTRLANLNQTDEDSDLLRQTIDAYSKLDSFVREPAPRARVESDPRNDSIVDYADVSFDDAI